jgi:CHASE2 domain-containing sensor protein
LPRHLSGDYWLRAAGRARRPDREHMQSLRRRVPYWFVVALLFGFAVFQIQTNPFGFSDLTQRYTQDIANLLIDGPYLYPQTGREQVSVALVDDNSLRELGMPWPWTYGAQARALDALLALKPRAVVADIMFVDSRHDDTLSELVGEVGRYRHAHVPLYFVGSSDAPAGAPPLRRELLDTGVRVLDPSILVNQGIVRQYPVTGACFGARTASPGCLSLALTVYKDQFPREPLAVPQGLMELVWGTRANPVNAKWMTVTDENGVAYACSEHQDIGWAKRIWLAFFDPASVRSLCPYTSVIPAESLIEGRDDADVARLANRRIVIYGASLSGVQDRSFTPVNGLIASVFVHAMALDNLIAFHGRPQQNVVTLGSMTLDTNTAQMLAVLPIVFILGWIHVRGLRRVRAPRQEGASFAYLVDKLVEKAWRWFALALALAIGLALTVWAGLSVANWVQLVFVSAEFAALLLVGLPGAVWAYLHHVAFEIHQLEAVQEEQGA